MHLLVQTEFEFCPTLPTVTSTLHGFNKEFAAFSKGNF